jgi:hypothetical protein
MTVMAGGRLVACGRGEMGASHLRLPFRHSLTDRPERSGDLLVTRFGSTTERWSPAKPCPSANARCRGGSR